MPMNPLQEPVNVQLHRSKHPAKSASDQQVDAWNCHITALYSKGKLHSGFFDLPAIILCLIMRIKENKTYTQTRSE